MQFDLSSSEWWAALKGPKSAKPTFFYRIVALYCAGVIVTVPLTNVKL